MKKLDIYFAEMNQSKTAKVQIGNITGVIAKLEDNSTEMKFGFTSNGVVNLHTFKFRKYPRIICHLSFSVYLFTNVYLI